MDRFVGQYLLQGDFKEVFAPVPIGLLVYGLSVDTNSELHPLLYRHLPTAGIKGTQGLIAKNPSQEIVKGTVLLRYVFVIGQDFRQSDKGLLNDVIGIQGREAGLQVRPHHRLVTGIKHRPAGMARISHIPKECR